MQKSWKTSCPMTSDSPGAGHRLSLTSYRKRSVKKEMLRPKGPLGFPIEKEFKNNPLKCL